MSAKPDHYAEVVSRIRSHEESSISVPQLAGLLAVKATTLNARFRRLHVPVRTIGRVNYIPLNLALDLASVHKYALLGWPTVEEASRLTDVKGCTIKAKCEKGAVESHMDLTKRLRVNPTALEVLRSSLLDRRSRAGREESSRNGSTILAGALKLPGSKNGSRRNQALPLSPPAPPSKSVKTRPILRQAAPTQPASRPFVLPPARPLEVRFITAKEYGLPETEAQVKPAPAKAPANRHKPAGLLCYDPDRPFSLSECAVGKPVRYGEYDGTIVGILDEPFSPKIKVRFPEHRHPLMQEVLLIVEKRRS